MPKIIDMRTRKKWRRSTVDRPQVARVLRSEEPGFRGGTGFASIGEIAAPIITRLRTR